MSIGHWQLQEKTVRTAFDEIARRFPSPGYMQSIIYNEVSAICHALARHVGPFCGKRKSRKTGGAEG